MKTAFVKDSLSPDSSVDELHDALLEGRSAIRIMEALGRGRKLEAPWLRVLGDSLRMVVQEAGDALRSLDYPVKVSVQYQPKEFRACQDPEVPVAGVEVGEVADPTAPPFDLNSPEPKC